MKKVLFLLVLLISVTLTACGDKEEEGVTTITYYGKADEELELEIISQFEAANPDIKVNYVPLVGGSNERLAAIQTVLQSGSSDMDVFAADGIWPAIFSAAGWVDSFEDLGVDSSFFDDYSMTSNFMSGDQHVGIPFQANGGLFFYRADLLDKYDLDVPTTTAEIEAALDVILAGEDNPDLLGYGASWKQGEGLSCAASEFFYEQGILVYDNGASDVTVEGVKAALDNMVGLIDGGYASTDISAYGSEQRTLFKEGNLVFARDWVSAFAAHYFNPEGNNYADVAGAAIVPGGAGVSGNWGIMISSFSEKKDAAVKFAQFRTSPEMLVLQFDMIGALPPHDEAYQDADIQALLGDYADVVYDSFENTVDRAVTPYYGEVSNIIQVNVHSALTGLVTTQQAAQLIVNQIKNKLG